MATDADFFLKSTTRANCLKEKIIKPVFPHEAAYNLGVRETINLIIALKEDFVLAPKEPTDAMLEEIWIDDRFSQRAMTSRYKAMLSRAEQ